MAPASYFSLLSLFGGLWDRRVSAWGCFFGFGFSERGGERRGGRNGLGSMMVRGEGGGVSYIADEAGSLLLRSGGAFRLSVEQCRL